MRAFRQGLLIVMGVLAGAGVSGCPEDDPGFKTVALSGTVEAIEKIDAANARVRISYYSEKNNRNVTTEVIVTPETEIFINGIEAKLEDVKVGERAEGESIVTQRNGKRIITVRRVRIERAAPVVPRKPGVGPGASAAPTTSRPGPGG